MPRFVTISAVNDRMPNGIWGLKDFDPKKGLPFTGYHVVGSHAYVIENYKITERDDVNINWGNGEWKGIPIGFKDYASLL